MIPTLRRAIAFLTRHRADIAQILAILAVVCMILSAYLFRPQPESLARYRPTPGPKDYYDPRAPWYFAIGAALLVGALIFTRRAIPSPSRAGGRLDHLSPLWAWILVAPGLALLFTVAEINGQMIEIMGWTWRASARVQIVLLLAGIALLIMGTGGFRGRLRRLTSPLNPLSVDGEGTGWPPDSPSLLAERGPGGEVFKRLLKLHLPRDGTGEYGRGIWRYALTHEIMLLVILTLIALGARLYLLHTSVRTMIDEIHFAFATTYFRAFPDMNLLEPMPTTASFPFIFSYGEYGTMALFGRGFFGLRSFSAILGALTIPATYGLARELFDRRVALLAALVLLTFPPHVHYSRLALNNIADPLFGTLALYFLARGLRLRHRLDYTLAGAMLGATQYFYEGGRMLFPALFFGWIGIGLVLWRPRPSLRGMILLALVFVIIAAPVYYTLEGVGFPLFDRIDKAQLDDYYWQRQREENNLEARIARFKHSLLAYVNSPENTLFHYYLYYGGEHPLLLVYVIPPFLLGAVIAAWMWYKPGGVLMLWMLLTALGNATLLESAVSARYVLAFPAVAILVALGIRVTLPMMWPQPLPAGGEGLEEIPPLCLRRGGQGVRFALMLLLAGGIAVGQAVYYFDIHLDHFTTEVRQQIDHDVEDALLRSADFTPGTEIWLIGSGRMMSQTDAQRIANFFADGLIVHTAFPSDLTAATFAALPRDRHMAFFFAPYDLRTLEELEIVFGPRDLQYTPYDDLPPDKAFVLFYVPAQIAAPGAVG